MKWCWKSIKHSFVSLYPQTHPGSASIPRSRSHFDWFIDPTFIFMSKCFESEICFLHLKPAIDFLYWPFPSGTRVEGPVVHGEAGRSPCTTGTAASGLLWGSEMEVFGCHPDWPAPLSPHYQLQEVYGRWLFSHFSRVQTMTMYWKGKKNHTNTEDFVVHLVDDSASKLSPLEELSLHSPSIHWKIGNTSEMLGCT